MKTASLWVNALTASFLLHSTTGQAGDYFELEKLAEQILCVEMESPECTPVQINELVDSTVPLTVGGITLPDDALRDAAQQTDMVTSGLYIKADGSVSNLSQATNGVSGEADKPKPRKGPSQVFVTTFEPKFPAPDDAPVVINVPAKQ